MPASKAVSMGVVLSNGTDFISLFFRSEKNDLNNEVVDKFYWVQSNASGVPTSGRNNALNGYFSSQSAAEADAPDGYGNLPPDDEFQNRREWGYNPEFPFDTGFVVGGDNISLNRAFGEIAQFVNAGTTYVMLTLHWDDVFRSLAEQNANADASWIRYDTFVNYVKNLNPTVKIAIRIVVTKAGRTHNDMLPPNDEYYFNPTNNLWPLSRVQKDNRGNIMRNIYDNGCFSYADSIAVSQAIDFVTKVKNRYGSPTFMGSRLMQVSVATTTQHEAGYDFENDWDGQNYYPADAEKRVYDYSDANKLAFETAMLSKYGSLASVNAAWGLSSNTPISPPLPPSDSNDESISLVYSGIKGNDWWYHNYSVMKAFHVSCMAAVGNTCKYVVEFGSCTDPLSVRRLSINVADFASFSDMMKAQFGTVPSNPSLGITLDVIRSNYTKKIGNELNTGDFRQSEYAGEGNITNFMRNSGTSAIQNGALDILFISNSASIHWPKQSYDDTLNAFIFLKQYAESNPTKVVPTLTENYALHQILNDSTFLRRRFQEIGGYNERINLKISSSGVTPPDNGVLKSVFTFNPSLTSDVPQNGYLQFLAFSHGIVFRVPDPVGTQRGLQCKMEYKIKNSANQEVITLKDNYGGFHPNYQPFAGNEGTPPAESYYRVWTPSHGDYPNLDFIRAFYNNFTPINGTPFNVANDRGNNHFDQYSKYISAGVYTLSIKNTGLFPFKLRAGKVSMFNNPDLADVFTTIPADNNEYFFTLNVTGASEPYKINAFID